MTDLESIFGLGICSPKLAETAGVGDGWWIKKMGKPVVIGQGLTILGWLLQRSRVRVLLSYILSTGQCSFAHLLAHLRGLFS